MNHASYWPEDDILQVCFADKYIARETSENWIVHKSYAEDGDLEEVVFFRCREGRVLRSIADGKKVA